MVVLLTVDERRRKTLRLLSRYAEDLPLLPAVEAALKAIPRQDPDLPDRIEQLARLDPALAVRLLYVANHTFNFVAHRDVTLASIMVLAGSDAVIGSMDRLHSSSPAFVNQETQRDIWLHSVQVAMAAKALTHLLPEPRPSGEESYLYGLLHDLGRLIMLVTSAAKVDEVNESHWTTGKELVSAEQQICGFDHGVLGWLACRNWNFPDSLALVNKLHHSMSPDLTHHLDQKSAALVNLISLADELSLLMTKNDKFMGLTSAERKKTMSTSRVGRLAQALSIPIDKIELMIPLLDALSRDELRKLYATIEPSDEAAADSA